MMKSLLFLVCTLAFVAVSAQKVKLIEGDLSALKGATSINTRFVYENITIGKNEEKESDYITRRRSEINAKTPGKGDSWAEDWVNDRKNRYEPRFNDVFNKESGMTVDPNAKYTILFKTMNVEPGFKSPMGFGNKDAEVSGEAWIVETADPSHVVARLSVMNAPGRMMMADFNESIRIGESYAMAARGVARFIKKA
ncbi:hypothetical protein [Dinghuibacter silviterrae]|uniref:Uncharacterized protein n=1 Tax=Dinghuibacter silviterrae TaxID=1539049 RepID=A0A4V3GM66_9BACT|nr:hypothetical protein [Dinghuibacter silviterrae]TDX02273.1 hypothetical protein EDB95_3328 [Dinghuibacter silviterrae]